MKLINSSRKVTFFFLLSYEQPKHVAVSNPNRNICCVDGVDVFIVNSKGFTHVRLM